MMLVPRWIPVVPGPEPGKTQDRLVDAAVLVGILLRDEQVVRGPDGGPTESFGNLGGGLHAFSRSAVTEIGETQPVVHAADASVQGSSP